MRVRSMANWNIRQSDWQIVKVLRETLRYVSFDRVETNLTLPANAYERNGRIWENIQCQRQGMEELHPEAKY